MMTPNHEYSYAPSNLLIQEEVRNANAIAALGVTPG
jgi:hypothetical protein